MQGLALGPLTPHCLPPTHCPQRQLSHVFHVHLYICMHTSKCTILYLSMQIFAYINNMVQEPHSVSQCSPPLNTMLLRHSHIILYLSAMQCFIACVHPFFLSAPRLPPPPASMTIWGEHSHIYSLMDLEGEFTGDPGRSGTAETWGVNTLYGLSVAGCFPAWVYLSTLPPGVHKFPISSDPWNFGIN